jgi:hypothetical protein
MHIRGSEICIFIFKISIKCIMCKYNKSNLIRPAILFAGEANDIKASKISRIAAIFSCDVSISTCLFPQQNTHNHHDAKPPDCAHIHFLNLNSTVCDFSMSSEILAPVCSPRVTRPLARPTANKHQGLQLHYVNTHRARIIFVC